MSKLLRAKNKQKGAAAIEFALIASIFFTILIGILELGRVLFYVNSAAEATRLGARIAVVCAVNAPGIKANMIKRLNILTANNIQIEYCTKDRCSFFDCPQASCKSITVAITGVNVATFIPFVPDSISKFELPTFSTSLPRESMDSTDNSLCT